METFAFQAEIHQLMSLIIHAFYSNKDIFLRELIANASDALDKYRYAALSRVADGSGGSVEETASLRIRLHANTTDRVLTIEDNGIGMTRQELIDNLGTIARSGTKQFIQTLTETKDMSLIGQFGVGFYSGYLVADKVSVVSRSSTESGVHRWESDANGSFTITQLDENALENPHGTRIELSLKEDQVDYLQESKIREIVSKHSAFIGYPIELFVEREAEPAPAAAAGADTEDGDEPEEIEAEAEAKSEAETDSKPDADNETEADVKPEPNAEAKPEPVKTQEWVQLNTQKPIWMRRPDEVSEEDYAAFYKTISQDWEDPLATKHFHVEGQLEFRGLLFIPKRQPFDLYGREKRNHLKLYVRRVFITDNSEDYIPEWLSFVRGLVDSDDLPLNVSREMLQQNRIMKIIQKNVVKKCIELIADIAADTEHPERYKTFYEAFSKNLKLGVYDDDTHREKLIPLLRFYTSKSPETLCSLEDYIERMKPNQKNIYYMTGVSIEQVANAPFTESLRKKDIEILYFIDTIDEYLSQRLTEYKDKKLVNITKDSDAVLEDLQGLEDQEGANEEAAAAAQAKKESYAPLCAKMKELLEGKVEDVRISLRLTETPAILVSSQYGWTANMERIMKAQALQANPMAAKHMASKKILEINPNHRMVRALKDRVEEPATRDMIHLIYEASMINSGFGLENPNFFVGRVYRMIEIGLNLLDDEPTETTTGDNAAPDASADSSADAGTEAVMETLD
jgi:molecular chaperone HtpG